MHPDFLPKEIICELDGLIGFKIEDYAASFIEPLSLKPKCITRSWAGDITQKNELEPQGREDSLDPFFCKGTASVLLHKAIPLRHLVSDLTLTNAQS